MRERAYLPLCGSNCGCHPPKIYPYAKKKTRQKLECCGFALWLWFLALELLRVLFGRFSSSTPRTLKSKIFLLCFIVVMLYICVVLVVVFAVVGFVPDVASCFIVLLLQFVIVLAVCHKCCENSKTQYNTPIYSSFL
jgi:hypothetical protein